jgi:hypothetical protein
VTERVLTARELNRPLLARQLLLERARLPVTRALERVGPLHAQGVESTYVNLWSRVEGFRREQLTRALDEKGRLLLDLPRAPLPPAETPAPPRFLLRWDNLYMAHRSGDDVPRGRLRRRKLALRAGPRGARALAAADEGGARRAGLRVSAASRLHGRVGLAASGARTQAVRK